MSNDAIVPFNNISRAIERDKAGLNEAIQNVLFSGQVILGPNVKNFEADLANYLGIKHVIGLASGTDALEIAIKAGMPEGKDTVLTAANAGGYTTVAAKRAGFKVKFVDVDFETKSVSDHSFANTDLNQVGILVITHLYGLFSDVSRIISRCRELNITVIEDSAQALGAKFHDNFAGTMGDIGTTSFYPTKNLGALGDGGAIFTNSDLYANKISLLRQYGWINKYEIGISGGVNSRLDDIQASILSLRLPMLQNFNKRRRQIINYYADQVNSEYLQINDAVGENHAGHLAVATSSKRSEAISHFESNGIQTSIHFPIPDYAQPAWLDTSVKLRVTERLSREVFSLPCFPELYDSEIEKVGKVISKFRG